MSAINLATGAASAQIEQVGNAPIGVAITPDGKRAYVASRGAATVSMIDVATNVVIGPPIKVGVEGESADRGAYHHIGGDVDHRDGRRPPACDVGPLAVRSDGDADRRVADLFDLSSGGSRGQVDRAHRSAFGFCGPFLGIDVRRRAVGCDRQAEGQRSFARTGGEQRFDQRSRP